MSLIPLIRSTALKRRTLFTISISLDKEIISLCPCYTKKGLLYIIIAASFNCQPYFYSKYTEANAYLLYNIYLVSVNKYISRYCYTRLCVYYGLLIPYLNYYKVLGLIYY